MNANNSAPVTAQRLHARVFGVWVPRCEHVDATVRSAADHRFSKKIKRKKPTFKIAK